MERYSWLKLNSTTIGQKFGKWTLIGPSFVAKRGGSNFRFVVAECGCGRVGVRELSPLKIGRSSSCHSCAAINSKVGLSFGDTSGANNGRWKGGYSRTPEYRTWNTMIQRCHNPNNPKYPDYAGRGISVCDEWRGQDGFLRFLEHVGHRPSREHSIDRIDNDKGYGPGNVRWATRVEQANNTRKNVKIVHNDREGTVQFWSNQTGIPKPTLYNRISRGLSSEEILSK